MWTTKRGLAFGLALFFLSSCATCKSFSFPNDADDRPACRTAGLDNVVTPVPPWVKEDGEKTPEMYFNFDDDGSGWEPVMRRC